MISKSLGLIIRFYLSCCFCSLEHALEIVLEVPLTAWKSKVEGRITAYCVWIVSGVKEAVFYLSLRKVQITINILQTQRGSIGVIFICIQFLLVVVGFSQIH